VTHFQYQQGFISGLAFSPDAKVLAVEESALPEERRSGTTVHLCDVATGQELRFLTSTDLLTHMAFSPDGTLLAASGYLGSERPHLWEVATAKERWPSDGIRRQTYAVAFSPDGRLLAAGDYLGQSAVQVWEVASGKKVYSFEGHHSGVWSLAFSPDERSLASGGGDSTILVWNLVGGPHARTLAAADLDAHWTALAGVNGIEAMKSLWALVAAPQQAVPFFKKRLQPLRAADPARLTKLIADLDSENFGVRRRATEELQKLAESAEPALRRALAGQPPLEVKGRIEELLKKLDPAASSDRQRQLRAIMALERMATPEAKELLASLAQGIPEARLTQDAKASLKRLARTPSSAP
jgi:hypothetical protein